RGVKRSRELDVVGPDFAREVEPFLDGPIRIAVPHLARRELLQRRRQDAEAHEFGFEGSYRHLRLSLAGPSPTRKTRRDRRPTVRAFIAWRPQRLGFKLGGRAAP